MPRHVSRFPFLSIGNIFSFSGGAKRKNKRNTKKRTLKSILFNFKNTPNTKSIVLKSKIGNGFLILTMILNEIKAKKGYYYHLPQNHNCQNLFFQPKQDLHVHLDL